MDRNISMSYMYLMINSRISYIDDTGVCHIGLQRKVLIALLLIDVVANVYMTVLFIIPLTSKASKTHSESFQYSNVDVPELQNFIRDSRSTQSAARLRSLTIRTLIGCILTITSATA